MIHLGIDLHKNFSFITAMDQQGNVLTKTKVSNRRESFLKFLSSYPPSKSQIVLEAIWNWYWLWDLLEERDYRLQMAHPLKTEAIASARVKTDKIDSEILAHLSRSNLVPQAYVVDRETRFQRELIRYRTSLVRFRATPSHPLKQPPHMVGVIVDTKANFSIPAHFLCFMVSTPSDKVFSPSPGMLTLHL